MITGSATTDCINGLPSSLSSKEDPNISKVIDNFIPKGYYFFPELKFQCETDIKRVNGYFIVDTNMYTTFYFQVWREQNISGTFILMGQVSLNFSADCQRSSSNEACYIDYPIPDGLEVEIEDFIGFYTDNNTLARPLFSLATSSTQVYLYPCRTCNVDVLQAPAPVRTIYYRPQVTGELKYVYSYV